MNRVTMALISGTSCALIAPAYAQDAPERPRVIVVTGTGTVETAPTLASVQFSVRGEGDTADAATRALVARQKAILGGLASLTGGAMEVRTGTVELGAARAGECAISRYGGTPALSSGTCTITGYVATLDTTVRLKTVKDAGTAAGLAGRLGAERAAISGYELADPNASRGAATAAALADAKTQAKAIASGSGETLGPILSVRNGAEALNEADDIVLTGARSMPPAPPPPPPPVAIDLSPRPIETVVRLTVTYRIGG